VTASEAAGEVEGATRRAVVTASRPVRPVGGALWAPLVTTSGAVGAAGRALKGPVVTAVDAAGAAGAVGQALPGRYGRPGTSGTSLLATSHRPNSWIWRRYSVKF
jgi:hypothetical protein